MNSFSSYGKTLTLLSTVLLFFSNIPMCESAQKREGGVKRVLVLYSFHEGLPWEMALGRSLRETLESKSDFPIELYTEHTDLVNYSDEAYIRKLVELYHHKYSKYGMDLIIGVGDEAAGILRDYGDELFPETPKICVLAERPAAKQEYLKAYTAVLFWSVDIKGNVDLIGRMLPETRNLFIVAGTSLTDREVLKIARKSVQEYMDRLSIYYLTDISEKDLIQKASRLPPHSAILFLAFFRDAEGKSFVPRKVLSSLSKEANAPVFGIADTYLGHGIVSGKMASAELHGTRCAEIALQILEGLTASMVAPEYLRNPLMADWRQVKRWGIDESALPAGSIVRFKEISLWEQHKR